MGAPVLQLLVELGVLFQVGQRRFPRRRGQGVSRQGAGLVDRPVGSDLAHEIFPAAVGSHRKSTPDDLSHGRKVWSHPEALLGAASRHPKPRHHLIKDENSVFLCADLPKSLQEAYGRRHAPHVPGHGLHDDAGHLTGVGVELGLNRDQVIVLRHQSVLSSAGGDTRAGGNAKRCSTGTSLHQESIGVAMISTPELDHLGTAGRGPGQPDSAHGGLGAGVHQPHDLHGGQHFHDQLRQFDLTDGGGPERGPLPEGLVDGPFDPDLVVTQDHGAPGAHEVQVIVPIGVPDPGAFGPDDEQRVAAHATESANRAVYPSGYGLLSTLKELPAQLILRHYFSSSQRATSLPK